MFTFSILLICLMGAIMIVAVLLQPSKGGGLSTETFGGAAGQISSMFGARRAADFLQKFTIGLAIVIMLFSIIINKFMLPTSGAAGEQRNPVTQGAPVPPVQQQSAPMQQQQTAPAQQQQAAPTEQPKQGN